MTTLGPLFRAALREMVRRRTLAVTLFMTVLYLTAYGITLRYAASAVANTPNPILRAVLIPQLATAGLFFAALILAFFAITSAVGGLSGDRESGVFQVVATAPVRRSQIVLGKLLGYWLVLACYAVALCLGVFVLLKALTGYSLANFVPTAAVFAFQPVLLAGLTMLGSAVLPTVANGVVMFSLYALSLIGGVLEQVAGFTQSTALTTAGIITSLVIPADSLYRKAVSLSLATQDNPLSGLIMLGPFGAQSPPSIWMLLYVALYLLACVGLTLVAFRRRDL